MVFAPARHHLRRGTSLCLGYIRGGDGEMLRSDSIGRRAELAQGVRHGVDHVAGSADEVLGDFGGREEDAASCRMCSASSLPL